MTGTASWRERAGGIALFALLIVCGLLVFAFGVDYHTRFPTNTSGAYKIGLSVLFLIATVLLHRSKGLKA